MSAADSGVTVLRERVASFGEQARGTSLYLIRAVEGTVSSLTTVCEYARTEAKEAIRLRQSIIDRAKDANLTQLDPDDKAADLLGSVLDKLQGLHNTFKKRRLAAVKDKDLVKSGHLGEVVEAYDLAGACVLDFFNAVSELRTAIMEYDAERSESMGSFDNVDALMKAITQ